MLSLFLRKFSYFKKFPVQATFCSQINKQKTSHKPNESKTGISKKPKSGMPIRSEDFRYNDGAEVSNIEGQNEIDDLLKNELGFKDHDSDVFSKAGEGKGKPFDPADAKFDPDKVDENPNSKEEEEKHGRHRKIDSRRYS